MDFSISSGMLAKFERNNKTDARISKDDTCAAGVLDSEFSFAILASDTACSDILIRIGV